MGQSIEDRVEEVLGVLEEQSDDLGTIEYIDFLDQIVAELQSRMRAAKDDLKAG